MGYDASCWSCKASRLFENRVPVPILNQVQVLKLEVYIPFLPVQIWQQTLMKWETQFKD